MRAARGFTLLEVLAALVILALAFTILLQATGASLALTHKSTRRTRIAAQARSLLDSAATLKPPQPGTQHGEFDDGHQWRLQITPWHPPHTGNRRHERDQREAAGGPRLYKLNLTISWGPDGREQSAHFATLRAVSARSRGRGGP